MTLKPEPLSAPYTRASPSYHLFSTVSVIAWSLFILATLITHELAHHVTWDIDRIAARKSIPWAFNALPTILRTVFDQGHGPITAMHLARLAVDSLDAPWSSANTWMEVFWLADRRWAGPFGLWMTFETLVSRKLRKLGGPRVSLGFWLFAALSVVALVTPVTLSRAYHVTTGEVKRQIMVPNVATMSLTQLGKFGTESLQRRHGNALWSRGVAIALQFPGNMYTEIDVRASPTSGAWLIAGNTNKTTMSLLGIRVAGGCEYLQRDNSTFQDLCTAAFGDGPSAIVNSMTVTADLSSVAHCSNITLNTKFGREPWSNATTLFSFAEGTVTMSEEGHKDDIIFRCDVTAGVVTASVDGRAMSFNNFTYHAPSEYVIDEGQYEQLDPLAQVMQADLNATYSSAFEYKLTRDHQNRNDALYEDLPYYETRLETELIWDGVVAMSAAIWMQTTSVGLVRPDPLPGVQKFTATGIRRDNGYFCVFAVLLGIWFVGMFASSAVLTRPTWASSLDGYAVARLLQQQPVLVATPEAWLAELEENPDMLQEFTMHEWRDTGS